jgi:hypothetical protein
MGNASGKEVRVQYSRGTSSNLALCDHSESPQEPFAVCEGPNGKRLWPRVRVVEVAFTRSKRFRPRSVADHTCTRPALKNREVGTPPKWSPTPEQIASVFGHLCACAVNTSLCVEWILWCARLSFLSARRHHRDLYSFDPTPQHTLAAALKLLLAQHFGWLLPSRFVVQSCKHVHPKWPTVVVVST